MLLVFALFACSKSDSPDANAGTTASGSGGTSGSDDAGAGNGGANSDAGSAGNGGTSSTAGAGGQSGSGGTSGSSGAGGNAGNGGASGAGGSDSGVVEGAACGSRGLPECPDGTFCQRTIDAQCGISDAPGTCTAPPTECIDQDSPVCGCDDETYSNACIAASMRMSVKHNGACGAPVEPDCLLDTVTCRRAPPECEDFHVPTQEGACYGPCVPIEACVCQGPSDCPDEGQFTCHLSAGHCGPYVN